MIIPTPWRLVEDRAIILGRDGREVQLGAIGPGADPWHMEVEWRDADGRTGVTEVEPETFVPVVLPDMGRALATLFGAFPETQILQITDM